MVEYIDRLFPTAKYETYIERFRAQLVYVMVVLLAVGFAVYAVTVPDWADPDGGPESVTMVVAAAADVTGEAGIGLIGLYTIAVIAYALNLRGQARIASWGPFFMWYCSGVILTAMTTNSPGDATGPVLLLSVIGGLLIGVDGIVASVTLSLMVLFLRWIGLEAVVDAEGIPSVPNVTLQILVGSFIVFLFLRYTIVARIAAASEAIEDRELTGDILREISVQVAKRETLKKLLASVVNQINDQFDFVYHTQVFLLDDQGARAELAASTGIVGQQLITQGHALAVGSQSVIGAVTGLGEPIIAIAGSQDSIHRKNEQLPDTAVEAAFPLRIGDRTIGALDVQSRDRDAFQGQTVIATFQALADSVTLAIDNVRQYQRAEARLQENARLFEETQTALREVELLNERLTDRAWSEYMGAADKEFGVDVDLQTGAFSANQQLSSNLRAAIHQNSLVQTDRDDIQVIAVPLRVRGRVIGAMEFEMEADRSFSPEDYDLVQEVTERFGLAVENSRLVDQSQRVAQREALVNQISSRLQSANTVNAMLNEAARGLRDALRAEKVAIRLGSAPDNASDNGEG